MPGTPIPINYAGPLPNQQQIQNVQSAETQAGAMHTGADLLNSMTEARLDRLSKAQDIINQEIGKTMGAASTPVPVSGTGAINLPGQHNWAGIPTDYSPTYSHSGSVKQGIGNMIRGIANVVGAYETKSVNDKNKALSIDIQRIMEAHQGIETANQALQQNPQDKEALAAKQKNNDIINALLSDPKKRKQISKAFDISFVDPSQNNTPEQGALKDAVKSYSEQLQAKMPIQMGPNQVAQQRLGQLMELQKNISEQFKAVSADKTAEYLLRAQQNQDKLELDRQKEQDRVQHWHDQAQEKMDALDKTLAARQKTVDTMVQGRKDVAGIQANAAMERVNKTIRARFQYLRDHDADPLTQIRILTPALNAANSMSKGLTDDILKLEALRDAKGVSDEAKDGYNKRIHADEEAFKNYKDVSDSIMDQITIIRDTYVRPNNNQGGNQDGSGSTNDGSDINIPEPIAPVRPSLQHSDDIRDLPKTIQQSQPVQPVGGSEDKDDDKYINIIKQGLAGG